MKRTLLVSMIFALALITASCSFSYDFVIINQSQTPIVVVCTFKQNNDILGNRLRLLGTQSVKDLGRKDAEWIPIGEKSIAIDTSAKRVTVTVQPETALRVDSVSDAGGISDEYFAAQFDFEQIQIAGAQGTVMLEGKQAQTQFTKQSNGNYALVYKSTTIA